MSCISTSQTRDFFSINPYLLCLRIVGPVNELPGKRMVGAAHIITRGNQPIVGNRKTIRNRTSVIGSQGID